MLAALKFFLGQDDKEDDDGEGDDEEAPAPTAPTRGDVYKATSKVQPLGNPRGRIGGLPPLQHAISVCNERSD